MPHTSALDASSTVGPLPIDRPNSITSPGTTSFSCILLRPLDMKALEALRFYKGSKAILLRLYSGTPEERLGRQHVRFLCAHACGWYTQWGKCVVIETSCRSHTVLFSDIITCFNTRVCVCVVLCSNINMFRYTFVSVCVCSASVWCVCGVCVCACRSIYTTYTHKHVWIPVWAS